MAITREQAINAFEKAELIITPEEINQAFDEVAEKMTIELADKNPVLIGVMNGGLVPLGKLIDRLHFPLRLDYLHATRYREREFGTELEWKKEHEVELKGQTVVVIDDILDEGYTLQAIVDFCEKQEALDVRTMVMVEKEHDRGVDMTADYVGLSVPDRYVFGFGMDYRGYWRNAPGIFAINED